MAAEETLSDPSSRLCVACGLCCDGTLHDAGALTPEEVPLALGLGMNVTGSSADIRFKMPCHLLEHRCCTVYADRPSPCRSYRCRLLRSLEAGESNLDDCLGKVRNARNLLGDLEEHLPQGMTLPEARASARSTTVEDDGAKLEKAKIKLHAFALNVYLDKYFRNEYEVKYLRPANTERDGK